MTACCCSGYQPKRDIRPDECRWPPVLEPAGPWRICDCPEGVALDERLREMAARNASGIMAPLAEAVVIFKQTEVGKSEAGPAICCSACRDPEPGAAVEWNEKWRTWLCPECGNVLAEEAR